jgi:hypothetical protein
MKYSNGTIYEGVWEKDKKNGYGILKNARGQIIYQGT